MTKTKHKIFTVFLSLVAAGLSTSLIAAQSTILDVQLMAVFRADDGLQVAIKQTDSESIEVYDDMGSLIKLLELPSDTSNARGLDWNADGTRLAVIYGGSEHLKIIIWDVITSTIVAEQEIDFARYVYWNPVDSDVLMIMLGSTLVIWDVSDSAGLTTYDPSWPDIEYAAWSPSGAQIALIGSGTVRIVDAQTHGVIFERYENLPMTERINYYFSFAFSPDEDRIALYDLAAVEIEIWNINTGQMEVSFDSFDTNSQHYEILRWLDGGLVGIDLRLDQVVVYDLNDGSFVHIVDGVEYSGVITLSSDNTLWFVQPQLQINSPFFVEVELPPVDNAAPMSTSTPTAAP